MYCIGIVLITNLDQLQFHRFMDQIESPNLEVEESGSFDDHTAASLGLILL